MAMGNVTTIKDFNDIDESISGCEQLVMFLLELRAARR